MAAKNLYDALIDRAESIEEHEENVTVYKRQHTFIQIEETNTYMRVTAGFHLETDEWHLAMILKPPYKDMSDVLRSLIICIVDNMTVDDDYYTFDQFVAAKCVLDWLLYV